MNKTADHRPVLVIHGGAGTIKRDRMTPEREAEYRAVLEQSLKTGYAILDDGGTALDAVQAAVRVMEDSPLFNAGRGAVFTHEGVNECDACIMDGTTRNAGAVAAVRRIRNPIDLARLVLEKSVHVLLAGDGAEQFAVEHGMTLEHDPAYFFTEHRWQQLQQALAREAAERGEELVQLDHAGDDHLGTVGAVALDRAGNLAAATSTGGMTNKRFGRIGDTPIIGAGTYADNAACAVSSTGHGEYIMRAVLAFRTAALMAWRGMSLAEAAERAVADLTGLGGTGGLVAVDHRGNIAMPFNCEGMYRGCIDRNGALRTAVFRDHGD